MESARFPFTRYGLFNCVFFLGDLVESYIMDLKYDGIYRSWAFLTTRLVTDKTTIPLLESNLRHFMALEVRGARAGIFLLFYFVILGSRPIFLSLPFLYISAKGTRQQNSRELQKQERQFHPTVGDEI